MANYTETTIWKNSLTSLEQEQHNELLIRLTIAYSQFREHSKIIANQIYQDNPGLTIHDITHIDSLWQTASLIAGSKYKLTPIEIFVFGGAGLVHDLALTKIVYSENLEELKKKPEWHNNRDGLWKTRE